VSDPGAVAPVVFLEGAPNFRDLGGHMTKDGHSVRRGLVFRSGHLAELSDRDVQRLTDLGLRTVVDFRREFEVALYGRDRLPPDARLVALPIAAAEMDEPTHDVIRRGDFTALPDLSEASRDFIRHNTESLGAFLHLLAETENLPLVFHCIGGKDRTGVAAALVLAILGVPWARIRADYLRTNELLEPKVGEWLARLDLTQGEGGSPRPSPEDLEAFRRFFILEPDYIDAALDEVTNLAGSIEGYVSKELGVKDSTIDHLRSNLLEPTSPGARAGQALPWLERRT
jgi:protein-tyrosine phosphatase